MSSYRLYSPYGRAFSIMLALLLGAFLLVLFLTLSEAAFERVGLTRLQAAVVIIATFLGSYVNIPLRRIERERRLVEMAEVRVFWVTYRIPQVVTKEVSTLVAANLGGAIIPTFVSVYLLASHPPMIVDALIGTFITAIIVHMFARKVYGVGIVAPALLPPFVAAIIALLLAPGSPTVIAYVSGTLGTLVGADLANLGGIENLGASIASIGGAGKFDGVFLTGIIAVLLA